MSPAARGRGSSSNYTLRSFVELLRHYYYCSWKRNNNNVINVSSSAANSSSGDHGNSPTYNYHTNTITSTTTQKGLQLISCKNWAERLFLGPSSLSVAGPPPSLPPSPRYGFSAWAKWVLGTILTVALPFWKQKWERLKTIEGEAELVAEQVENVAEIVEQVANVAENLSAEVAESIPSDGGKLKEAALLVERVSKVAAHEAHVARDFLHKVDKLKDDLDDLEKMVEPNPTTPPPCSPESDLHNAQQGRL